MTYQVDKTDEQWREELSPEEYAVLRQAGTERAFTGAYTDTETTGVYSCKACHAKLFESDTKFHSGCGWPSFYQPLTDTVEYIEDVSMGMKRVEVRCATCGSHLGHVFPDGYGTPTGDRYCINSVSLTLEPTRPEHARMIEETGTRRRRYWDLHDFGTGRGLEIGPLHSAIVRRGEADVRYVDVHDQETLRAHYAGDPGVPGEAIPHIDYTLISPAGEARSLVEAAGEGAPFSWVVASHVIEHIPDVVTWLQELAELVADDGTLVLAVPDRRYCFDVHRPPTSVGAMLQAHHDRDTRPSVRAVYDHFSRTVAADAADLWEGTTPTYAAVISGREPAAHAVQQTLEGHYVDCHVWLFTPDSFLEQLHELRRLGLSSWWVEELVPTPVGEPEFQVRMRRLPRASTPTDTVPGEVLATGERPDWLDDQLRGRAGVGLERRVERLEQRLARKSEKVRELRSTLERQRRRARRAAPQPPPAGPLAVVRRLGGRVRRRLSR